MRTLIDGTWVTLPGTIGEIRKGLSEDERAVFDAEIETAAFENLPRVAARWALPARARAGDEELFRRLEAGDYTGVVYADGTPVEP
ncbi:hypothetical protein OG948_00760 [Embleya sp. NBC_00888]|uniref:hypothetical protein n=1 Tax=Embleya sp. NBC_00888 TaxID=2975960 RepID=UPI003865A332|nr:hypothetical protein OG948_00760 [Embleya sp. NBC_00888]